MSVRYKVINILIFGFTISSIFSIYLVSSFDTYIELNNFSQHSMIKGDLYGYFLNASKLKEQILNGRNFFSSNLEYTTSYLHPKLLYLFFELFNINLVENSSLKIAIDFKKVFFLISQSAIYFFSVFLFINELNKIFSKKVIFYILLFLSFEISILTFHSSFFTESIFFSLQLITLTLIINKDYSIIKFVLLAFVVFLMFLQRSPSIYYFIIITIYLLLNMRRGSTVPFIAFLLTYFLLLILFGYQNYKRSNLFYVTSQLGKVEFYRWLIPDIITHSKDNEKILIDKKILDNNINQLILSYDNNVSIEVLKSNEILTKVYFHKTEKERVEFSNKVLEYSFDFFKKNKLATLKTVFKNTLHFAVLNPLESTYFFNKFLHKGPEGTGYYKSQAHINSIPIRIIYTLLIYLICLVGIFECYKLKKYNILIFMILSIFYFTAILSWIGMTRYNAPNIIFLSIFFGLGLNKFAEKMKLSSY